MILTDSLILTPENFAATARALARHHAAHPADWRAVLVERETDGLPVMALVPWTIPTAVHLHDHGDVWTEFQTVDEFVSQAALTAGRQVQRVELEIATVGKYWRGIIDLLNYDLNASPPSAADGMLGVRLDYVTVHERGCRVLALVAHDILDALSAAVVTIDHADRVGQGGNAFACRGLIALFGGA